MYKSPYPLEVQKQTNGDFIISDGFLFWRKIIRIKPDSGKVVLTIHNLFRKKVAEVDLSVLKVMTAPTTEGAGIHIALGVAGVLCIHDTEIIYTKANSAETVIRELQSLNEQLGNCLSIDMGTKE